MFNLVSITDDTYIWTESESFIQVKNSLTTYKFEWAHNEIRNEPYINEQTINEYLEKYEWKLINKYTPNSKYPLVNLYTWWIISKS
jgi:hypothetical protein